MSTALRLTFDESVSVHVGARRPELGCLGAEVAGV